LATKRRDWSLAVATIARCWIRRFDGLRSIPAPGGVGYEEAATQEKTTSQESFRDNSSLPAGVRRTRNEPCIATSKQRIVLTPRILRIGRLVFA
jgi:hypothetical protein